MTELVAERFAETVARIDLGAWMETPGARPQSVAGFLVDALRRMDVSHIFAVPGRPLLALYEELSTEPRVTCVLAKHEEGAGFMAEGYAQASGKLGVTPATSGPGALHALTAAASATSDGVPMLVITAQTERASYGRGSLQDSSGVHDSLDTVAAFAAVTKESTALAHPNQLPRLLAQAVRVAYAGRPGAVHLAIPADMFTQPVHLDPRERDQDLTRPQPLPAPVPAVVALAEAVRSARRGVVLAGQGDHGHQRRLRIGHGHSLAWGSGCRSCHRQRPAAGKEKAVAEVLRTVARSSARRVPDSLP